MTVYAIQDFRVTPCDVTTTIEATNAAEAVRQYLAAAYPTVVRDFLDAAPDPDAFSIRQLDLSWIDVFPDPTPKGPTP